MRKFAKSYMNMASSVKRFRNRSAQRFRYIGLGFVMSSFLNIWPGEDLLPSAGGGVLAKPAGQVQGDSRPCGPEGPHHPLCLA